VTREFFHNDVTENYDFGGLLFSVMTNSDFTSETPLIDFANLLLYLLLLDHSSSRIKLSRPQFYWHQAYLKNYSRKNYFFKKN
jgi:hypothetical protein